jgi:hypothetical protein
MLICYSGFCSHHSTGRRLAFVKVVKAAAKAIKEAVATYEKEFPWKSLSAFSAKNQLKLGWHSAIMYSDLNSINLIFEKGTIHFVDTVWAENVKCEGKKPNFQLY